MIKILTLSEINNWNECLNSILCCDALDLLKIIPDNSIDTIVTSPPYNKGYYEKNKTMGKWDTWKQRRITYDNYEDNLPPETYKRWQITFLQECIRVIKDRGSIFYNHKSIISNNQIIFPEFVLNFNIRQIIVWDRGNTPQIAPIRFYPTTEYVFWITKTNITPKFYRTGKYNKEVWRINPIIYKDHPATFPIDLPRQCILSTTDKNDIIADFFAGSFTTAVACVELNRNFICCDISEKYCNIGKKRLSKLSGNLF